MVENNNQGGAKLRVHLVLSAGGMKCISYAGAIKALSDKGVKFASVSASSGGSVIGALVCAGVNMETLTKAVYRFDLSNFAGARNVPPPWVPFIRRAFLNPFKWPFAKYESSRISDLFLDILRRNDPKLKDYDPTFKELSKESKTPFATCGVDIRTHKIHVYSRNATPDMKVSEALSIATSVPLIFPPHKDGEKLLLDGALVSQSPVWLATVYPEELPILILRPMKDSENPYPRSLGEYVGGLIDLGGGSRDYYLINQIPRALLIEINPGKVRFDQFDLGSDMKGRLISNGDKAVETNWQAIRTLCLTYGGTKGRESEEDAYEREGREGVNASEMGGGSEKGGVEAMSALVNALSPPAKREQVFISYSHKDAEWLAKLQTALAPYIWNRALNLWDDTQIPKGARWREEITKALAAAKVAVLLITMDYLASKFVREYEMPAFLEAAKAEGLIILPVIVGACGYEVTPLREYQMVNDPKAPLNSLKDWEQQAALVNICKVIDGALNPKESSAPKPTAHDAGDNSSAPHAAG